MSGGTRRFWVVLSVLTLVLGLASTALAFTWTDVARYKLNEAASENRVDDSVAPVNDGWRTTNGIVTTGWSYTFEGWHRADDGTPGVLEPDDEIPASTGSFDGPPMYSIFRVKQRHEQLDPGSNPFRVTLKMTIDELPNVDLIIAEQQPGEFIDVSYNVAQKGKDGDTGGQWKIEIVGRDANTGTVRCTFKGQNGGAAKARSAEPLDYGDMHIVKCRWNGQNQTADVYVRNLNDPNDLGEWTFGSCTNGCPDVVEPNAPAYLGGKPDSTSPIDAYAGTIADITVQTSSG